MRRNYCSQEVLPFTAMVVAECLTVGLTTIYKAAVLKGLSYHIFMTYSYALSAILILPLAFIFHRKQTLPPFTFLVLGKFCLLGVLGFISQSLGYSGISYSNPTLAAALCNITPATTFILAVLLRVEKLNFKATSGQAKIVGTLVSIGGALVAVLYEGHVLISAHRKNKLNSPLFSTNYELSSANTSAQSNWILGGVLLSASYVFLSLWDTAQAKFVREYPAEFILVFFYNLSSCIISLPVGFYFEPNLTAWKLTADVRLYSILYSGIIGSGFGTMVRTWGLRVKGPVYVALFKPLSIAIAAILGVSFLGDDLYLGSVVGSVIISMGFYTVIWGKGKEEVDDYDVGSLSHDAAEAPLLTSHIVSIKR
ncbi:hypothetical protein CDL12_03721 [Handroanthus impetiginosus]|uniref:WAT1-related protein n=1 Tax=Handroanthus impetiginosus TaxID=429701 RepID=A0A2G9I1B5_9LAMI|nr:hypothetical protein CDL12_03721 [Handroanthus impetiginosus]